MELEVINNHAEKYATERMNNSDKRETRHDWYDMVDAFTAGGEWRINSVWHDMKVEEPQEFGIYTNMHYPQIPCLVHGQLATGYGYGVRYWNITEKCWDDEECDDFECKKDAIEEWAYLDDLLPSKKEDKGKETPNGSELIAQERARQIKIGYDNTHDMRHPTEAFINAAAAYLYAALGQAEKGALLWPWDSIYFKPKGTIRNLVKAGALIAAAIDRLLKLRTK